MATYPLRSFKGNTKLLHPMNVLCSEEYLQSHYDLYLTAEPDRKFRLHSVHPLSMDEYLSYDIRCPHCGELLAPVGGPLNYFDLGLYACRNCGKR